MKFKIEITGSDINLALSRGESSRLTPSSSADQIAPKKYYVYAHRRLDGVIFYIGKGIKRRAWDEDRHFLWHRYVNTHLGGQYSVQILQDNLVEYEAEELESEWMGQESETLVNWQNMGRKTDFAALDRFHALRKANLQLATNARELECLDLERSIDLYKKALSAIAGYAFIKYELGLVGELLDEDRDENGYKGELEILDRITLCLIRSGRAHEAVSTFAEYFEKYKADRSLAKYSAIEKRVSKAMMSAANNSFKPNTLRGVKCVHTLR